MKGVKNFITGFSLSLISVSFAGQLYSPLPQHKEYAANGVTINLFKTHDNASEARNKTPLIKTVAKYSLINTAKADTLGALPKAAEVTDDIEGVDDDVILNVNVDDIIPIDFTNQTPSQHAEVLKSEEENLSAMLPDDVYYEQTSSINDDPWEVAQSGKSAKNNGLFNSTKEDTDINFSAKNLQIDIDDNTEISHKVAERIKQSIIFPIPEEILNDENLTPTFIKGHKNTSAPKKKNAQPISKQQKTQTESVKIIKKSPTIETAKEETSSNNLLDSISSWLLPSQNESKDKKVNKATPSYSSQATDTHNTPKAQISTNDEFASFYETLQETTKQHKLNKVLPSELKLSFQPNRAEISGQTLRWLKAFSEVATADNTYLQIRLDATTPSDIQRKRLNLLYSIFANNGVDAKKIDTVFSSTEPNAFIIRSLTYN